MKYKMTQSDYNLLKQQIILGFGQLTGEKHGMLLSMLKNLYKEEINSARRFEQITTIGQLLEILELRDFLSEDNVDLLKHIARRLSNSEELLAKIQNYEVNHVHKENFNYYAHQNEPIQAINENLSSFVSASPYNSSLSKIKKDRMYETIMEEIGTYWKDLGRNLGIREGVIDEININHTRSYDKASELLKKFERKADPQRWFFVLCEGLEKARRKDLSRSIQEIMTMNI